MRRSPKYACAAINFSKIMGRRLFGVFGPARREGKRYVIATLGQPASRLMSVAAAFPGRFRDRRRT